MNDDASINFELLYKYSKYLDDEDDDLLNMVFESPKQATSTTTTSTKTRQPSLARYYNPSTDEVEYKKPDPYSSLWHINYILRDDLLTDKELHKFRLRFRLPYNEFKAILKRISDPSDPWSTHFMTWHNTDCTGKQSSPIGLLLLGALRYIGRGFTFDDIEEAASISQYTHRRFFHAFITFGSTTLYEHYVKTPSTTADVSHHTYEMEKAGFHGCIGSMDATNVKIEMCRAFLAQVHKGFKASFTSRTYNITVNHRRRILSSTSGHPARWNDKTLVRYDQFASGIQNGEVLSDTIFYLYEYDEEQNITKKKYIGNWILADNGYLDWATTIPPIKNRSTYTEVRWSEWAESMRKDVECTFEILKGRWCILKSGICLHGIEAADKIWLTCCALHNLLLDTDGLDQQWENGVPSSWEGDEGLLDMEDVERHVPFAIRRCLCPNSNQEFDSALIGRGNDFTLDEDEYGSEDEEDEQMEPYAATDGYVVRLMNRDVFRSKLVEHFDILFQQRKIEWPSRLSRYTPRTV